MSDIHDMYKKNISIKNAILKIKKYAKQLDSSEYIDIDLNRDEFEKFKSYFTKKTKKNKRINCYDLDYNKHVCFFKNIEELLKNIKKFKKLKAFI